MDKEKMKELAKKVNSGVATQEEELEFLKYLNQGVDEINLFIKDNQTN